MEDSSLVIDCGTKEAIGGCVVETREAEDSSKEIGRDDDDGSMGVAVR